MRRQPPQSSHNVEDRELSRRAASLTRAHTPTAQVAAFVANTEYASLPPAVVAARDGFFQTFGAGGEAPDLSDALGRPYAFEAPGITIKPYPACTRSHPAFDAALAIAAQRELSVDSIEVVGCDIAPAVLQVVKVANPRNAMEAKFSLPFCLAAALLDGKVVMDTFSDQTAERAHGGGNRAKLHGYGLVRTTGSPRHAAGRDRNVEPRDRESARSGRAPRGRGLSAGAHHAAGVREIHRNGSGQVGARRQGSEHPDGLTAGPTAPGPTVSRAPRS